MYMLYITKLLRTAVLSGYVGLHYQAHGYEVRAKVFNTVL